MHARHNWIDYKSNSGRERGKLDTMLQCLLHEPFYTHGTFQSPENGFFIGHWSMPGSFAECMPIWNETRKLVLFLTGEYVMDRPESSSLANRGT